MALRVLILHGLNGSNPPHWQDWLANKLEAEGIAVSFPFLPEKDNPKREAWEKSVEDEMERFKPNAVVCHSLGCILWFHLASKFAIEGIEKLLLVAPPDVNTELSAAPDFFPAPIPSDLRAAKSLLIVSDSDPYLSMKRAGELFRTLDIPTKILQDAGHINSDSGHGPLQPAYDFLISE